MTGFPVSSSGKFLRKSERPYRFRGQRQRTSNLQVQCSRCEPLRTPTYKCPSRSARLKHLTSKNKKRLLEIYCIEVFNFEVCTIANNFQEKPVSCCQLLLDTSKSSGILSRRKLGCSVTSGLFGKPLLSNSIGCRCTHFGLCNQQYYKLFWLLLQGQWPLKFSVTESFCCPCIP